MSPRRLQNSSEYESAGVSEESLQRRHDLKTALLTLRWVAEIFENSEGERPSDGVIAMQLRKSHDTLESLLSPLLQDEENSFP
ncbi:MAG: hypothetical protein RIR26_1978 [Pseudomonadota bacterium]|jgi:hypothetical protein